MERLYIMTMRQLKIMNNKEIYKLNLIIQMSKIIQNYKFNEYIYKK